MHSEKGKIDSLDLIIKLTDFAKTAALDVETIVQEQLKDQVIETVKKWVKRGTKPETKPHRHQDKAIRAYLRQFDLLFIENQNELLCIHEYNDDCSQTPKICLPLSLFLNSFKLAHSHPLSGHHGESKTLESIKRYFYWPGLYKWVKMLLHDCLDCQKNKPKRKDLNEAPLQQWGQLETTPMKTIHIDHKGPLRPMSNGKNYCLVVVDAFSRYIQVYPCKHADSKETINLLEKYITSFGIPQQIIHDNGSAFISNGFVHWSFELGITLRPRTTYAPWTNGKVEVQNKHLTQYFRHFINDAGSDWSELTDKFAFAHNTAVNSSTGYTPYEIVFGIKPQIPISLKLGLFRDNDKRCISEYCTGLSPHVHSEETVKNEKIDKLLQNRISSEILKRENLFKTIYSNTYKHCRRVTNQAHYFRNQHKLGKPIKIGSKVLLENRSKQLLRSQKLLHLRSGPYTVVEQVTDVNYKIENDTTSEKKIVHRNHIVEYFPKENIMPKLVTEYSTDPMSDGFYNHLTNRQIDNFNQPKKTEFANYSYWPVISSGYQHMTNHDSTIRESEKNKSPKQSSDSGQETMNLRTLFESTSFNPDIQPITSSTPYPKRVLNELSELDGPSSSQSHRNIRTQFHVSPPENFYQLSNNSAGFSNYAQSPNNSENYYENSLYTPIPEVSSERPKRTKRPTQKFGNPIPSSLISRFGKK